MELKLKSDCGRVLNNALFRGKGRGHNSPVFFFVVPRKTFLLCYSMINYEMSSREAELSRLFHVLPIEPWPSSEAGGLFS